MFTCKNPGKKVQTFFSIMTSPLFSVESRHVEVVTSDLWTPHPAPSRWSRTGGVEAVPSRCGSHIKPFYAIQNKIYNTITSVTISVFVVFMYGCVCHHHHCNIFLAILSTWDGSTHTANCVIVSALCSDASALSATTIRSRWLLYIAIYCFTSSGKCTFARRV